MSHATEWLISNNPNLQAVCCIYPTAPFLSYLDIKKGFEVLESTGSIYAFSTTEYESSVFRALTENDKGELEMLYPQYYSTRTQDLPISFFDAAQFYWGRPKAWIEKKEIFAEHSKPVSIPYWRVVDIDTPDDLERATMLAELIFSRLNS